MGKLRETDISPVGHGIGYQEVWKLTVKIGPHGNPVIKIVNTTGEVEESDGMDTHKKMGGWAQRKGLSSEQAEDFADYYMNPRGWYGSPSISLAPLEKMARKMGLKTSEAALSQAVENAWFGEKRGHRVGALRHWAERKGLSDKEASEFANYVENHWYGEPEMHRNAALSGFHKRRMNENPLWKPLLPEPWQSSLGLAEIEADLPHVAGIVVGFPTTLLYSGLGELATKNEWAGTLSGLSFGLIQSEATRRWMPTIGTTTEAEAIKQRAGFARGQRLVVYSVTGFRSITSLVKMAAGVGTTKGAMGQGLDDMMAKIKEGKILDAVKMPWVTGSGMVGLGAAIDELEWPKLDIKMPEGFPKLGQGFDIKERIKALPESMKKHLKFGKKKAASPKHGDAPAINAGDAPAVSAGDEYPAINYGDAPAINAGLGKKGSGGPDNIALAAVQDLAMS
jgi:hypothetical protein